MGIKGAHDDTHTHTHTHTHKLTLDVGVTYPGTSESSWKHLSQPVTRMVAFVVRHAVLWYIRAILEPARLVMRWLIGISGW